jgi:hypothetical protein
MLQEQLHWLAAACRADSSDALRHRCRRSSGVAWRVPRSDPSLQPRGAVHIYARFVPLPPIRRVCVGYAETEAMIAEKNVHVPDELLEQAQRIGELQGRTADEVAADALKRYLARQ